MSDYREPLLSQHADDIQIGTPLAWSLVPVKQFENI